MNTFPISRAEVTAEINQTAREFEALLRAVPPDAADKPVPGLTWTVGEVAAHVLTVIRRGLGDRRRSSNPAATGELNVLVLEEFSERDTGKIADLFAAEIDTMTNVVFPRIAEDRVFPFHGGTTTTIIPASCIVLGELLIHGYDIANACALSWQIDPHRAMLAFLGSATVIHGWLKPGLNLKATYELHFVGESVVCWLKFADGTVQADTVPLAPVDHVLRVHAVEFYLTIPHQRKAHAEPLVNQLASYFERL